MKSPYKKNDEEQVPTEEEKHDEQEKSPETPKVQLITSEQLMQLRLDVIEGKIDNLAKLIKENL